MVRITTCPFLWGPLALYTSSPLILAIHLLIMQVATWMPIPSAAFLSLLWVATDRVMLLRVISSLMRLDCQLRVFNAEVTAFPRIAPPPRPHSWPTMLVLLFRTSGRAVFGVVPLSPFVTLAGREQGHPRQCLPAVWTFLICTRTFLLPWRGPWAQYEIGRGC